MALTTANVAAELESASKVGDPDADTLVSDLIDNEEVDGVNQLFRTIDTLGPGQDLSQLPERLAQFLHEAQALRPCPVRLAPRRAPHRRAPPGVSCRFYYCGDTP
ncbi:hypothetical protein ACIOKD_40395 [Streptomyces sp. NPDC087844]|uniref:hypothetical protein n=1 Tax=Streptomyces sp. NPDC087844 TaxID=3365805 RepID=UPI003802560B